MGTRPGLRNDSKDAEALEMSLALRLRPAVRPALGLLVAALTLTLLAAEGPAQAGGGAALAPEISLAAGINGIDAHTTLASLRGKPVVLAFWIPICPHCQMAASTLDALQRTYGAKGVQVLAVSHGKPWYVDSWLKQRGFRFGVGFDWSGFSAARYGVRSLPGVFLIGKDGTLRASGLASMDSAIRAELARP